MRRKKGKVLAGILSAAMIFSTATMFGEGIVANAETNYVTEEELENKNTAAPEKDEVVPNATQYQYQKDELAAFVHFGPNTFNEIEWGEHYGDSDPADIFTLDQDFDAETMVKTLQEAGFRQVNITAKHHDGFCIFASDLTEYDVANTNYKNGNGDILAEMSAACTKYDMDMGVYLSPWDINADSYGYYDSVGSALVGNDGQPLNGKTWEEVEEADVLDYNDYYAGQLEEILSNPKYGNNGRFVEVWMDGAKGSGANAQTYDFARYNEVIQKYEGEEAGNPGDAMVFQCGAYTTVHWIGNEDGYASEETWAKIRVDEELGTMDSGWNVIPHYSTGYEDGNQWSVPEADARITSGWFWGNYKKTPKTLAQLGEMYFRSVGHNAVLLLNIPPNDEGFVDEEILDRVEEFGNEIKSTFANNIAKTAETSATEVRGNDTAYSPSNVLDGDDNTYWTTNDGTTEGSIVIDLGDTPKLFDVVSIEEAIQYGQRITTNKVEYRNGNGEWQLFDEGAMVGSKRLYRGTAVRATEVRITVETGQYDNVPMISEIGLYKASEGFEYETFEIPEGMEVIDNTDVRFSGTGWNQETGEHFINGTSQYAYSGSELDINFEGSQIYLLGTVDPNHGKMEVSIGEGEAQEVDTKANERKTGQVLFASDTLEHGDHTLSLNVKSGAIGIEAALVVNNNGVGLIQLTDTEYNMNEDSTLEVTVVRQGGTNGEVKGILQPNPGTAIQDDFVTEPIEFTIPAGEDEVTVDVKTRRNTNETGDQYFTIEIINNGTPDLIVGMNNIAKITIKDSEGLNRATLSAMLEEYSGLDKGWYRDGWELFAEKMVEASNVIADDNATDREIEAIYNELKAAKEALVLREEFTDQDPFVFPWKSGEQETLEAEFGKLENAGGDSETWKLEVSSGEGWSNGKFLNSCNKDDVIQFHYYAEKAGVYEVTAFIGSGSATNKLAWSEPNAKIESGSVNAGYASYNKGEVTFDVVVEEAGAGIWRFTGPEGNSPQLDKLIVKPKNITLAEYTVTASESAHGSIVIDKENPITEGETVAVTITPNEGYKVAEVLVNGTSVGAVTSYRIEDISDNYTIEAVFEFAQFTEETRFQFPIEENGEAKILEAEFAELINSGEGEEWPLQLGTGSSWSNGEYVNAFNQGDKVVVYYNAEKVGVYEVKAFIGSGSATNTLVWSEENEKIEGGSQAAGYASYGTGEVEFEITVNESGEGSWVFTAPSGNSPQIDKFEIVYKGTGNITPPQLADYSNVDAAIERAILLVEENYVDFSTVTDAISTVERGLDSTKQEEVNAMGDAINNAIDALVLKDADYRAVDDAIAKANALTESEYVDFSAVNASVEAVVRGLDITRQEEVDAMAAAINKSIGELELKPEPPVESANYRAVDEAIAKANALTKSEYVDFSKVEAAIAEVIRGLDSTKQAEVDGMAQRIDMEIENLELKPVTPEPQPEPQPQPEEDTPETNTSNGGNTNQGNQNTGTVGTTTSPTTSSTQRSTQTVATSTVDEPIVLPESSDEVEGDELQNEEEIPLVQSADESTELNLEDEAVPLEAGTEEAGVNVGLIIGIIAALAIIGVISIVVVRQKTSN